MDSQRILALRRLPFPWNGERIAICADHGDVPQKLGSVKLGAVGLSESTYGAPSTNGAHVDVFNRKFLHFMSSGDTCITY